jgi:gluconate 2-dehydrogenase gamma chain
MADRKNRVSLHRRAFLAGAAFLIFRASRADAAAILDHLPWTPNAGNPTDPVTIGPWVYFTPDEGRMVEALADQIIPPDQETPGGRDSGCAVYLDRQLAGPYGRQEGLYVRPPFLKGMRNQGHQSEKGPAQEYREFLAALDKASRSQFGGKPFSELASNDQLRFLKDIEVEKIKLDGVDGKALFAQLVKDVQMGFFADPIYGGNRDMAAWKMIGFPGARYNYLDWVGRHNEKFPLPPVSLMGRAEWNTRAQR